MTYEFHVMHGTEWPEPFTRWFEQSCSDVGRHGRGDWWKVADLDTHGLAQPVYTFSSRVIER